MCGGGREERVLLGAQWEMRLFSNFFGRGWQWWLAVVAGRLGLTFEKVSDIPVDLVRIQEIPGLSSLVCFAFTMVASLQAGQSLPLCVYGQS